MEQSDLVLMMEQPDLDPLLEQGTGSHDRVAWSGPTLFAIISTSFKHIIVLKTTSFFHSYGNYILSFLSKC